MTHFGVLCYKGAGHLNPMLALSRRLVARGHRVTFIHTEEVRDRLRDHGLEFRSLGPMRARPPRPWGAEHPWRLVRDIAALRQGLNRITHDMEFFLRNAPAVLRDARVDALIMDEITLAGPTLAELLKLPYIVVSTSIPHNFGWTNYPAAGRSTWFERARRSVLQVSVMRMRGPVQWSLDSLRRSLGLKSILHVRSTYPQLAHITQLPQCLDFPRWRLPQRFYYAGPFVDQSARSATDFPWHRLDGRILVYASLGTTKSGDAATFQMIAGACAELHLQLVISLGGRRDPESLGVLPGNPIVGSHLPQLEILKRADVVISHGGLNTTLETLLEGKPMLVIPNAFDQPAVAARLKLHGVAQVLAGRQLSVGAIQGALQEILDQPGYRAAAITMRAAIYAARGLDHAVSVIEDVIVQHNRASDRATTQMTTK